ncbi:MAG: esterase family protein [Lachnospiraceae bacterium]|jgi:S-formylglutathione hydrolase FrmB|nr:esterase family protein [Lachnospiraceae bacterium]
MAVFTCRFDSKALGFGTAFRMILPIPFVDGKKYQEHYEKKEKLPVLWLLHGGSDNYADWHDCTLVQLLADEYGIAVVMPDAQNGSYANMAYGPDWFTYLSEEFMEFVYQRFPVSRERKDNFISGMSMGGLGTFKMALRFPERFAAACPIASAVDLMYEYVHHDTDPREFFGREFEKIFGHFENPQELIGSVEDCYALLDQDIAEGRKLPAMMMAQGTEDFTYKGNKRFYEYASKKGVSIEWIEEPGVHDWKSWNLYLPKVFEFIGKVRTRA